MSRQFVYYGSFASVVYFTDLFGVPAAAYSLRKLSPNSVYSGAAIRVRRSSDNTEQDINFVSSSPNAGIDTTALLSFVGSGNGFVTTWYDQSGNGNNATQTSGGNQPQIVNGGILVEVNNKTSIRWVNDNQQRLISNFGNITQPITIFSLSKLSAASGINASAIYDSFHNNVFALYHKGTTESLNNYVGYSSGVLNIPNIEPSTTDFSLFSCLANGFNGIIRRQGNQIGSGFFGNGPMSGISIGHVRGNPTPVVAAYDFSGEISEIIIYGSNKSSEFTAIETNINDYYNVF